MQDETPGAQQAETTVDAGETFFGVSRDDLSIGLIALGSVMMLIVIARMLGRRTRVQRAESETLKPPREVVKPGFTSSAGHDRLERLMTDAEELTRRLAAVLENKAQKIEVLIEQADARLAALDEAHKRDAEAPEPGRPPTGKPSLALADDDQPAGPAVDPLHRRVYDLADQGLAPVDIARRIDRPTGQVELILALRRA